MPVTVLVGAQWGDEGKGKVIDVLTKDVDMVVRFQGGNNAGHTVEFGDSKYVLHLIPSGIFSPDAICVIGNGVVVSPLALVEEMVDLQKRGIDVSNLQLSAKSHLIMPYHCLMDEVKEKHRAEGRKLGTTKRGIGPAYSDKAARCGIRAWDLLNLERLENLFREEAAKYNLILTAQGVTALNIDSAWDDLRSAAEYLQPYVKDSVYTVNEAIKSGKKVLFEGAQGAMLDIDHGTYPFVTSSNTTSGGACTGSGVSPKRIDEVIGVIKAYTTRVGAGPFPTELDDEDGERLRSIGGEFGATTGRPRRCGWFDAVVGSYSCMINGIDKLAIMKLDVLDQFSEIKVCVAYELDGVRIDTIPPCSEDIKRLKPIYETIKGWMCDTTKAKSLSDLPVATREYLDYISKLVDTEIGLVSVGPNRDQTILL